MKRSVFFLTAGLLVASASQAHAQLADRCSRDDQLNGPQALGRNSWSRYCGYISAGRETALNEEGEYQVYSRACATYPAVPSGSDCARFVPYTATAACISGLTKLGTCYAGCYTPEQRLAFGRSFVPIAEAYNKGVRSVTALARGASPQAFRFAEQPIRTFVTGDTDEDLFLLETNDGHAVEVTSEHPMVKGDGQMVKAKTLKEGDQLLRMDGNRVTIQRVSTFAFKGKVWNVQPTSHAKQENVLNVDGFLTGSIRFQNEWADENYRLGLRDDLDVRGL